MPIKTSARIVVTRLVVLSLLSFFSCLNYAGIEPLEFSSSDQEVRYKALIAEFRCLVCQNQNLADSNAELAQDLRQLTYSMILSGQSDSDIIQFMVSRYGDFVLYRPPLKPSTILLWLGPVLFAAVSIIVMYRILRSRRQRALTSDVDTEARLNVRKLLKGDSQQ